MKTRERIRKEGEKTGVKRAIIYEDLCRIGLVRKEAGKTLIKRKNGCNFQLDIVYRLAPCFWFTVGILSGEILRVIHRWL